VRSAKLQHSTRADLDARVTTQESNSPREPTTKFGKRPLSKRLNSASRREQLAGWLFVSPQVLGFLAFVLWPIVAIFWYSLHKWNVLAGSSAYDGLANYRRLLHDPVMPTVAKVTAVFSAGLVALNIALALVLAVLLNQRLRGTAVLRTVFFSPVVVSLVAWTIVWGFLLQDNGGINAILQLVGIHGPNWLRGNWSALGSVIVLQVFKGVGLNMVLFLAALQGVPKEMYEAAKLDGAGPWRIFRSITLPMITPTLLLVSIITVVGSLQVFAQIQILTGGGPGNSTNVLVYYLYRQAFEFHDLGYASTLAVLLFIIVFVLTMMQWRLRKRWVVNEF
jgi:multiple sugar transport system permease protein